MLYLGLVIGLLVGAGVMYLKNTKDLDAVKESLQLTQDKLKSVKSQLYKRRSTYRKKQNGTNGKKAVKKTARKKATANTKKTNI
tara:strand:- start:154 stop:405 length:252 start_codon:yes stop_codon:yes gene_type:complete